jgi:single-strand DNA-binding protein
MAGDINRVTIVGRLTRDPELRHLPSGTSVLQLGVAVNGRQKDDAGNWIDKPNFFDVKVFGNQADTLNTHLRRGAASVSTAGSTGLHGRPRSGSKRSKVEIVAQSVQFLDSRGEGGGEGGERQFVPAAAPAGNEDFSGSADDDIPF